MENKTPYLIGLLFYLLLILFLYQRNFIVFHVIIEITSLMLAFSFLLVGSIGIKNDKINLSILMKGAFLSSVVMVCHIISYNGMDLIEGYGTNEAVQFWIIGNLIFSSSFLLFGLSNHYEINSRKVTYILSIISVFLVSSVFFGIFPDCYIEGRGLTIFKIFMEYLSILFFVISGLLVYSKLTSYKKQFYIDYAFVLLLLLVSGLLYTNYVGVFEFSNALGHIFRVVALYILVLSVTNLYIKVPIEDSFHDMSTQIQNLKSSYQEVEKNAEIFKALYDDAPLGYQSLDENGCFVIVNDTYAKLLGYRKEEMIGKFFGDFMSEESTKNVNSSFSAFKERGSVDVIFEMIHKNGNIIPVRFLGKIAYKNGGEFKQTHCILMDVSNEVEYQKGIIESKQKLENIVELTSEGVFTIDRDGLCTGVNFKALEFFGLKNETEILGKDVHELYHFSDYLGSAISKDDCSVFKSMNEGVPSLYETEIFTKASGIKFDAVVNVTPLKTNNVVTGAMVTFRDKDVSSNIVNSLVNLTYHDTLTGLFNRRYFEEEIKNINRDINYPLSIVIADINGLKLINDAFGHYAGDKLLLSATEVFVHASRNNDFIARIGGDEFIIVMPNTSLEEAEDRVLEMSKACKDYSVKSVTLSISFGVNTIDSILDDFDSVYKAAEDSMYRMKLLDVPSMRSNTIDTIVRALYEKDQYSEEHSRGVSVLSQEIASRMNLSYQQINDTRMAGLLHDIGKIAIESKILNKNDKLTNKEYEDVKQHSEIGYRILNSSNDLRHLSEIILSHHEWWNGSGYPNGIQADEIPVISRIITVADAFDAMTTERTYRKRLSNEEALVELEQCSGIQFDPKVVKVFKKNFTDIIKRTNRLV